MINLYILLMVAAGLAIGAQVAINAGLAAVVGAPLVAANINFAVSLLVGLTALAISAAFGQPLVPAAAVWTAPRWVWLGGICGGAFVLLAILLAARLGTALLSATTIVGQLVASLLIDHNGWFGMPVHRLSATRIAGAVFLVIGVVLIRWK